MDLSGLGIDVKLIKRKKERNQGWEKIGNEKKNDQRSAAKKY
jgi:hypothetical protein